MADSTAEAVAIEADAAAEDVAHMVPDTERTGEEEGLPDAEELLEIVTVAPGPGDMEPSNDAVASADRVKAAEEAMGDTVEDSVLAPLRDADAEKIAEPVPKLGEEMGVRVAEEVLICETLPDAEDAAVTVPPLGVTSLDRVAKVVLL